MNNRVSVKADYCLYARYGVYIDDYKLFTTPHAHYADARAKDLCALTDEQLDREVVACRKHNDRKDRT